MSNIFVIATVFSIFSFSLGVSPGIHIRQGEAPFMVPVYKRNGTLKCSGIIITPSWILTGWDCANPPWGSTIPGYTSNIDLNGTRIYFVKSVKHASTIGWPDVELGKLDSPISFNKEVQPIKIDKQGLQVPSGIGDLYGYGCRDTEGDLVKASEQKFLTSLECLKILKDYPIQYNKFDPKAHVCSVSARTIDGDIGGAMVQNGTLVGVVQYHNKNSPKSPITISSVIARFSDWIKKTVDEPVNFI